LDGNNPDIFILGSDQTNFGDLDQFIDTKILGTDSFLLFNNFKISP